MFQRAAIQSALDDHITVPHAVTVLSPFSFEIHPAAQTEGVEYRVIAERIAFELRTRVATGYMAVGLRAAVVAGATSNPAQLARAKRNLEERGWITKFELSGDRFEITARLPQVLELSESELIDEAAAAAALLSEFVLDQLVITRPYGEMRPAVLREVAEEAESGDPWIYDPSERDRSSVVHRALENWLISSLRARGVDPLDPAGEPFFDVAWSIGDRLYVCEVKSTINSETKQLRLATGQLLHYMALLRKTHDGSVSGVILAASQPRDDMWLELLSSLDITLLWPDRWSQLVRELTADGRRPDHV